MVSASPALDPLVATTRGDFAGAGGGRCESRCGQAIAAKFSSSGRLTQRAADVRNLVAESTLSEFVPMLRSGR